MESEKEEKEMLFKALVQKISKGELGLPQGMKGIEELGEYLLLDTQFIKKMKEEYDHPEWSSKLIRKVEGLANAFNRYTEYDRKRKEELVLKAKYGLIDPLLFGFGTSGDFVRKDDLSLGASLKLESSVLARLREVYREAKALNIGEKFDQGLQRLLDSLKNKGTGRQDIWKACGLFAETFHQKIIEARSTSETKERLSREATKPYSYPEKYPYKEEEKPKEEYKPKLVGEEEFKLVTSHQPGAVEGKLVFPEETKVKRTSPRKDDKPQARPTTDEEEESPKAEG